MPERSWDSAEAWQREATRLGDSRFAVVCADCLGCIVPADIAYFEGIPDYPPWDDEHLRWCLCGNVNDVDLYALHGVSGDGSVNWDKPRPD
jgi:hypothetical protein